MSREDYAWAEAFLPWNAEQLISSGHVVPQWIGESDRFWYRIRRPGGAQIVLVDSGHRTPEPVFDHERLAASLSHATGEVYNSSDLPLDDLEMVDDATAVHCERDGRRWRCDLTTYEWTRLETRKPAPDELPSPDQRWSVFLRDHNLYLRSLQTDEVRQLTTDGEPFYAYAKPPDTREITVTDRILAGSRPPEALWSPDSSKLITYRLDERRVKEMYVLEGVPVEGFRPFLHPYRTPIAGDDHVPLAELLVVDVETGSTTSLDMAPLIVLYRSPLELSLVWWDRSCKQVYVIHEERGHRVARLKVADVMAGKTREVLAEACSTGVGLAPVPYGRPNVRVLGCAGEVVWYSERDGWGHLYLYDQASGSLKNRITAGAWTVHEIVHVDEENRRLYFTAGGREAGRNPYFRHLYRIGLDGSDLTVLTPEDADHVVAMSPSGRYFVDTFSRVDLVPVSVLRSHEGHMVSELEEGDIGKLWEVGWRFPERFTVKARDGVTDIYGVIVRPTTFDPSRRYPVIGSIYPGPQVIRTPTSFAGIGDRGWLWQDQALAELGFVVVRIDGGGAPYRSKAFLDVASGRAFGEAGGLADHVAGLRELASKHPYLDIDRVGIYGHSGGGYAAARAMLTFPDFYKVAVSSAGNHDQRGYSAEWGERYIGLPDGDNYDDQSNYHLACNLRGKLLLAYGELDDNVPPALTLRLVDALMQANKDFDLLVLPYCNHVLFDLRQGLARYKAEGDDHSEVGLSRYFVRKRWDYFVRHLLGAEPPTGYAVAESS